MTNHLNTIKETIDDYGVAIIAVGGDFAYTIGMAEKGLPDVVVSSPDPRMSHMVLNLLCTKFMEEGVQVGVLSDLIVHKEGHDLELEVIHLEHEGELKEEIVCQADYYYETFPERLAEGATPTYLQVMWPDLNGNLPTADDYNQTECPQTIFKQRVVN